MTLICDSKVWSPSQGKSLLFADMGMLKEKGKDKAEEEKGEKNYDEKEEMLSPSCE